MFDFLKKKKENELLDLSHGAKKKSHEEIPIPAELKQRLQAQTSEIASGKATETKAAETKPESTESKKPATSFFANFFGTSSSKTEPTTTPAIESTTPTSTTTSAYSVPTPKSELTDIQAKIKSITDRLYKIDQRIELLERKLDVRSRN